MKREIEQQRLLGTKDDPSVGAVEVVAQADEPEVLLGRCREVLAVVLSYGESDWPSPARWAAVLPSWFLEACGPETSPAEAEEWLRAWRLLTPDRQLEVEAEEPWTLSDWLHWLQPGERTWYWLGARIRDPRVLVILLDVPGHPSPVGALDWLLKAAGATEVEIR
ncbi:hypothetical protein FB561_6986 [Kribbella amoyensis]|uniref:Uncharacterized protein n=1 Tax=Kribbella amoyensis TaxID=996641 RepID=A0A561B2M1_9ACTN|nr:hypothetical protein [Kribbella amoyensis]TWD73101.1 hypothetical protein FB561_6986 [Kribbella amoyensis]